MSTCSNNANALSQSRRTKRQSAAAVATTRSRTKNTWKCSWFLVVAVPLFGSMLAFATVLHLRVIMQAKEQVRYLRVNQYNQDPVSNSLGVFKQQLRQQQISLTTKEDILSSWPVQDAIPNPNPPADGYTTFSHCMLLMDDNHRLTEWIAYHYHVLPLRYMIVTVDPRSTTSPSSIFNTWRAKGMYIEEWRDEHFWNSNMDFAPIHDQSDLQTKRDRHRGRQKYFYKQCLAALRQRNRTWVALNDSDEYLVYYHPNNNTNNNNQTLSNDDTKASRQRSDVLVPSQTVPSTAEKGAMIKYIRHEQAAGLSYYQSPCIGIPRTMFGAAPTLTPLHAMHLGGVDTNRLDTLRYRRHTHHNDFVKNALGKVIMDVSRIDIVNSPKFMSLHRPTPWHKDWSAGLRINHYLGSWESYSIREDCRKGGERSLEQWEWKATTNGDLTDDTITPWLQGFVNDQGEAEAKRLLKTAGLPITNRNQNTAAWMLLPEKLETILTTKTKSHDKRQIDFHKWVRKKYENMTLQQVLALREQGVLTKQL